MNRRQIASLLPDALRRSDRPESPTRALLEVATAMLGPIEAELDRLHENFSARGARDRFVAMLAQWLDIDGMLRDADGTLLARDRPIPTLPTGLGRLRELVAAAAEVARWRGTATGLLRTMERATGLTGFTIDENPDDGAGPRAFYFRVTAPAAARAESALLRRILELEKPAFVQCDLGFRPATTTQPDSEDDR